MNQRDDGGPAFPVNELNETTGDICAQHMGLTLRDYLAAKAMHAMTTGSWPDMHEQKEISVRSYQMADAMLKARKS